MFLYIWSALCYYSGFKYIVSIYYAVKYRFFQDFKSGYLDKCLSDQNSWIIIANSNTPIATDLIHRFAKIYPFHNYLLIARDQKHFDSVKEAFPDKRFEFLQMDFTNTTEIEKFKSWINTINNQKISCLINCFSICCYANTKNIFEAQTNDQIKSLVDYYYRTPILLTKNIANYMVKNKHTSFIINFGSTNHYYANPNNIVASSCEAGLNAFSSALSKELLEFKIKVLQIEPGLIRTNLDFQKNINRFNSVTVQDNGYYAFNIILNCQFKDNIVSFTPHAKQVITSFLSSLIPRYYKNLIYKKKLHSVS